jgi:hypothetical protein
MRAAADAAHWCSGFWQPMHRRVPMKCVNDRNGAAASSAEAQNAEKFWLRSSRQHRECQWSASVMSVMSVIFALSPFFLISPSRARRLCEKK